MIALQIIILVVDYYPIRIRYIMFPQKILFAAARARIWGGNQI